MARFEEKFDIVRQQEWEVKLNRHKEKLAEVYDERGICYDKLDQNKKAMAQYQRSLDLRSELYEQENTLIAQSLYGLATQ